MSKPPRNTKNLDFYLKKMTHLNEKYVNEGDCANAHYNQQLLDNWSRRYQRQGEAQNALKCDQAKVEVRKNEYFKK